MAGILRADIVRGPAKITLGGQAIYTIGDVVITEGFDVLTLQTPIGRDRRVQRRWAKVSFTPNGYILSAIVAKLYPFQSHVYGQSLFSTAAGVAVNDSIIVTPMATGQKIYAYENAIVTKMPDFNASATKTPFGPCEVTAYGKNYTLSGAANSLYVLNTHGTNTTVADTGWTIPTLQPYTAIWGASAPVTMESQNGWTASFNLETIEEPSDSYNMGDILAGNMNVTLTGDIHQVIVGGNSAGVESTLAAQFTLEKAIGDDWSETAKAYDIVISPIATAKRALTLTLKQMKLDSMQPTFGIAKQRILGVTFVNADEVTDGAVASAFAFTAVA